MLELHTWLASNGFTLFDVAVARDKLMDANEQDSCDMLTKFVYEQSAAMGSSLLNALFNTSPGGDKRLIESIVVGHINRVCQGFSKEVKKAPHLKAVSDLRHIAFDLNCWVTDARIGLTKIVSNLEANNIAEKFNVVLLKMEHCLKQFKTLWAPLQKLKDISGDVYGYDESFFHINESTLTLGMAIQCINLSMSLVTQAEEARNRNDPDYEEDDEEEDDECEESYFQDKDEAADDDDDEDEADDEEESDDDEEESDDDEDEEEDEEPRRKPPKTLAAQRDGRVRAFLAGPWTAMPNGESCVYEGFRVRIVHTGDFYRFMVNTHVNTNDFSTDDRAKIAALSYIDGRIRSKK